MKNVTALVLFCCTERLIDYSIKSFRKFYPDMKLIIIDNSGTNRPEGLKCTEALKEYCKTDKLAKLIVMPKNLGHGIAMNYGFQQVKTDYVYVFESDVEMRHSGLIEAMLKKAALKIYSVGPILNVCYDQGKEAPKNHPLRTMRRLWPYSSLISIKTYFKYPAWNSNNGLNAAPLLNAMQVIADSGKENKLMVEFNVDKYVFHKGGGTRAVVGIPPLKDYKKWTSRYSKST